MRRFSLTTAALLLIICSAGSAHAGVTKITLAPSGGDDTAALQAALDTAAANGRTTITLAAGTFRVGHPLLGLNSNVTIRGAGIGVTEIIADGSFNPNGLFQSEPLNDNGSIQLLRFPVLFNFAEKDTDITGQPVNTQRSLDVTFEDLTLGARGQTELHFDVSANDVTQRMFSLIWMEGYRGDWTNSQGQTPADIGMIDAEHAQVSTIRAAFHNVHFDGMNRDRTAAEPGGPFDPNPDVRNAIGVEGGIALVSLPPNPVFFFKPINADISVSDSFFDSFPGQAGLFAPQLVGRGDPAWSFGHGAAKGAINVRNTEFSDVSIPLLLPDISDMRVDIHKVALQRSLIGILVQTNVQSTFAGAIGYPATVPSSVKVDLSSIDDSILAGVLLDEVFGPPQLDTKILNNEFGLAAPFQAGVVGFAVDGAQFTNNSFVGIGYAAITAIDSTAWKINANDFCSLAIPPSAPSAFGFPPNDDQEPIVLLNSTVFKRKNNGCDVN
jgi:hypothetical protein